MGSLFNGGVCLGAGCQGWELNGAGTVSMSSTTVRTGSFSMRTNPVGAAVGWMAFGSLDTTTGQQSGFGAGTGFFRFYFRYATKAAVNFEDILEIRVGAL